MSDKKIEISSELTKMESELQESVSDQVHLCEVTLDVAQGFRDRDEILKQHSYDSILIALHHISTCPIRDRNLMIKKMGDLCISKMYKID